MSAPSKAYCRSDNLALAQVPPSAADDLVKPAGAFFHQPRAPGIPGRIPDKRDYLNHHDRGVANYLSGGGIGSVEGVELIAGLSRYSPNKRATLRIATEDSSMCAQIQLTPTALRELARMCIDAAHDIEVSP